jgi:hypothetical protein
MIWSRQILRNGLQHTKGTMAKPITDIRRFSRKNLDTLAEGLAWQDSEVCIIGVNAAAAPMTTGHGLRISVGIASKLCA